MPPRDRHLLRARSTLIRSLRPTTHAPIRRSARICETPARRSAGAVARSRVQRRGNHRGGSVRSRTRACLPADGAHSRRGRAQRCAIQHPRDGPMPTSRRAGATRAPDGQREFTRSYDRGMAAVAPSEVRRNPSAAILSAGPLPLKTCFSMSLPEPLPRAALEVPGFPLRAGEGVNSAATRRKFGPLLSGTERHARQRTRRGRGCSWTIVQQFFSLKSLILRIHSGPRRGARARSPRVGENRIR